jgi:hypothetical protein
MCESAWSREGEELSIRGRWAVEDNTLNPGIPRNMLVLIRYVGKWAAIQKWHVGQVAQ